MYMVKITLSRAYIRSNKSEERQFKNVGASSQLPSNQHQFQLNSQALVLNQDLCSETKTNTFTTTIELVSSAVVSPTTDKAYRLLNPSN